MGANEDDSCGWDSKTSTTTQETISRFTLNCVTTFAPACPKATRRKVAIRQRGSLIRVQTRTDREVFLQTNFVNSSRQGSSCAQARLVTMTTAQKIMEIEDEVRKTRCPTPFPSTRLTVGSHPHLDYRENSPILAHYLDGTTYTCAMPAPHATHTRCLLGFSDSASPTHASFPIVSLDGPDAEE